jgi:hypothetical protein
VVYNKEGEISVIMEKQWLEIVRVTSYDPNTKTTTTTTYYIWHYGDVIMIAGLGNEDTEALMDFIPKNDYSLIRYSTGINIDTDQKDWFIFGKSQLYKVDSETLKQTSYKISTKSNSGGSRMRGASTGYSNSIFTDTYNLGDKEFVGVQLKSRKKMIVVRLTAS